VGALLAACALPASARADATDTLQARLGPQGVVDIDPATDTARVVAKLDGTLTGRAEGAAATIGMRWVRANRAALGLTQADLDTLAAPTVRAIDGIRHVRWRQIVDGIEVADAELRVNVAADGRLINVLGSPSPDLPTDTTPRLARPDPDAELTIYDSRLAYRYTDKVAGDEVYDTVIDADTGAVLKRSNMVKSANGRVWDNHPSLIQAPKQFDLSVWGTAADKLQNQWMHVYADLDKSDSPAPTEEVVPGEYAFQPFAGPACTDAKPCAWNGTTRGANVEQNAVQAYYLANRFREHLAKPPISFNGFEGADPLILETSDAEGTNNANMTTPPDGQSPRMQMYLWSSSRYRSVNSGDDASILWHEYAHGLTERTVVDASGVGALNSAQAWAMGEGWSDYYAKDLLVSSGHETDTAEPAEVHMGVYMDRVANSTRFQAIDCPVGAAAAKCPAGTASGPGGFTYGDFGRIYGSPPRPEVHADGEIWAQTLWDLRTAIGAPEALRLITSGLRMTPREPTFLDARNAILQADQASGGEWHTAIWSVFARRGMGVNAGMNSGVDPIEDFTMPAVPATTLLSAPPALTNQRSVVFTFSGTGDRFECSLDGEPYRACSSGDPWVVADGSHTFAVRAVNDVGPDATPAVHDFTVDTAPPDTFITWGPPPILTTRDFSVAFGASEGGGTFACAVDGGAAAPCTSPLALAGLGDGTRSVVVTAIDAAGNVDPTPARSDFSVIVPGLPPAPGPTPMPVPTATVTPKRSALTSAAVPKTVSRRAGKVKVTLRGVKGAKVSVQAKIGSRVVGRASRTLRGSRLSLQLALDKKRLRTGATVRVVVKGTGTGLTTVTRSLKFRLKA
jgi:hypothetical protein